MPARVLILRPLSSGLYLDLGSRYSRSLRPHWTLFTYQHCIRRQDCYMGDIGGISQAAASNLNTAMTDATNIELQQHANAFNAQQAAISRDWSANQANLGRRFAAAEQLQSEDYNTKMSNTAMQRRVADLKAAGLNPMIAATSMGGGASAPAMSAPGAPGAPGAAQASGAAAHVNDVLSGSQALANLKLTNAQTVATTQGARKTELEGDILTVQATPDMLMRYSQALQNQYSMTADQAGVVAQTKNLLLEQTLTTAQQRSNLSVEQAGQIIANNIASMDATQRAATLDQAIKTQSAILSQQGQEASNIQAAQSGLLGKTIAYLQAISTPVNTAAQAAQAGTGAARNLLGTATKAVIP